eukprot:TRINITY_DN122597_c0_g1_i1.p1 TRINITY_DN122597_c0_g1~~TRINITY_DN122597_c0_g1_i1.p1  ORF type:complete len:600 (+),score=67.56 TRINITY_DN122597_c0_g1_i1:86-1885(+)
MVASVQRLHWLLLVFAALFESGQAGWASESGRGAVGARTSGGEVRAGTSSEVVARTQDSSGREGASDIVTDAAKSHSSDSESESDEHIIRGLREQLRIATLEQKDRQNVAVAAMMLGGVIFGLALFQAASWPDDDIRRYMWCTASAICSTLFGVLLCSSLNSVVKNIVDDQAPLVRLAFHLTHFTSWFLAMQLALRAQTGASAESEDPNHDVFKEEWVFADSLRANFGEKLRPDDKPRDATLRISTVEVEAFPTKMHVPCEKVRLEWQKTQRRTKVLAEMMSNICMFAGIFLGQDMQLLPTFSSSPLKAFAPGFAVASVVLLLAAFFQHRRQGLRSHAASVGQSTAQRADFYDSEMQSSEDGMVAYILSFLTVQALIFLVVGKMPTTAGLEGSRPRSLTQVGLLFGAGVIFGVAGMAVQQVGANSASTLTLATEEPPVFLDLWKPRIASIFEGTLTTCLAWCFFWGLRWSVDRSPLLADLDVEFPSTLGNTIFAFAMSALGFSTILVLDKVMDSCRVAGMNPQSLETMIACVGTLVGFSWSMAFDDAFTQLVAHTSNPTAYQFLLTSVFIWTGVPAWRRHILSKALLLCERAEAGRREE